ncbi:EamA family transporter [Bradyrhizobium prioriisuperbiae]|uniref:EamA family transporter n=1 Tax=Bradyrhizobium prioriisuperbiae TaxID=2854389 RepID=UPI0028EF72CD|nr:EamA family transporter [Bradyrhizobium prioritasuperba]
MSIRDIGLTLLVALIWGLNFLAIKIGLGELPPLLFSAMRFLIAGLPWAFMFGRNNVPWRLILASGALVGIVQFGLLFIAMYIGLAPGLASIALQSQSFFTIILAALLLREYPSRWQTVSIFLCAAGLIFLGFDRSERGHFLGYALVLGAGIAWASYNVILRSAKTVDGFRLALWMCLVPPIPLFLASEMFEGRIIDNLASLDFKGMLAVGYTGIVSTIVAYGIWANMVHKYSPAVISQFAILVPIIAMSASYVYFGESYGIFGLAGTLLVLVGLICVSDRLRGFLQQLFQPARVMASGSGAAETGAFSSEVDAGSREENASKQKARASVLIQPERRL